MFKDLIIDGYGNELKINATIIEPYDLTMEALDNLRKYLVESKNKYKKNLKKVELELKKEKMKMKGEENFKY